MLKAYHMIGLTARELGRLHVPEHTAAVQAACAARFAAIRTAGYLRPAPPPTHLGEAGNFFPLDRLAGDDYYVFLSLGRRYWHEEQPGANYGFVFDAAALLAGGAILRRYDLMSAYEEALDAVVQAATQTRPPDQWSTDEVAALMAALEEERDDYVPPDAAYHDLYGAVERGDWTWPGAAQARDAWHSRVAALQARAQYSGAAALTLAQQDGARGTMELLVRGRLPLDQAVALIIAGEEVGL